MASTSQSTPVRNIENNNTSDTALALALEAMRADFNKRLLGKLPQMTILEEFSTSNLACRNYLDTLIKKIKREESKSRRHKNHTNVYSNQYTVETGSHNIERLIVIDNGKNKVFLPWEDIFDLVWNSHVKNGHPGADELTVILTKNYKINKFAVDIINEVCYICLGEDKPYSRCVLDIKPMIFSSNFAFTHIMSCEDLHTGFIHLRPLSADTMETEICVELLRIFTDFGPPSKVYSCKPIFEVSLEQLKHITKFAPMHIEVTNIEVDAKKSNYLNFRIAEWMRKSESNNWAIGCYVLQGQMNNETERQDEKTPFAKVFKKLDTCNFKTKLPEKEIELEFDSFDVTSPRTGARGVRNVPPGKTSSRVGEQRARGVYNAQISPKAEERRDLGVSVPTLPPIDFNEQCLISARSIMEHITSGTLPTANIIVSDTVPTTMTFEEAPTLISDDETEESDDEDPLAI